jgi:hypothetical protein
VALTAPAANATYVAGSSISLSASATDSDGQVAKVEFFAGTTKIGEKTAAPYTVSWGNLAAGSYQLTAKATDDKGGVTTSAPISVAVSPKNQLPVASISAPVGGASFTQGSPISISASASDSDGQVAKVEFFANSTKIGEKTTAPYSVSWTAVNAGSYALSVKVTDNQAAVTTSTTVSITVNPVPGANVLPVVALTSPVANASVIEGGSVTLTASATDSDGQVAKVEFFAGSAKIGEKTAAPFSVTWTNVLKGVYALTAKATDNKGGITTSATTTFSALVPPTPTAPAPGPSSPTAGNGLKGEFYDLFGNTVAKVRTAISGKTPAFGFTATSIDYPSGTSSSTAYTSSWSSWLGTDGTGAPTNQTLETSIVKLSGFIQIKPEHDVQTGNSTIEVDFTLASQGFAGLTVNGKQVTTNEANWTFSTQTARVSFPAAGYYPIEVLHSTGWDATGTELYSSIPGTANPGRGTVKTPSLVPKSVLFTAKPSSARMGVSEEMVSQVDSKLVAYPNPSDGSNITFQTDQFKSGKMVVLTFYDMAGRVALQHSVTATDNTVNVQALSLKKGMYTVAINGEGIANRTRVIIQ